MNFNKITELFENMNKIIKEMLQVKISISFKTSQYFRATFPNPIVREYFNN